MGFSVINNFPDVPHSFQNSEQLFSDFNDGHYIDLFDNLLKQRKKVRFDEPASAYRLKKIDRDFVVLCQYLRICVFVVCLD